MEDLRKRVNTLALKGTPAEQRVQPKQTGSPAEEKGERRGESTETDAYLAGNLSGNL